MELSIDGLTAQGAGVGRYQGLTVFVAGALPGETVTARLTQVKKSYAHAQLLELDRPAATRLTPACESCASCGGCALQHVAYSEQLKWKRQWLADALRRIGGVDTDVLPAIPAAEPFFYRNRVQLHALWQDNQLNLGFYERGSKEGEACLPCMLMRPVLTQIAQVFTELLPSMMPAVAGLQHVALRCDSAGDAAMLTLVGLPYSKGLCQPAEQLISAEPRLLSVWANWGKPLYGIYGGNWRKLAGAEKLPDTLDGLKLEVSPAAFTQVNSAQASLLYQRVAAYAGLAGKETLLDIYSGIGAIALYVARQAREVIGVEEYAPAVADATRNAQLNGLSNCRFECGRAEIVLPRLARQGFAADVVVLDPPRAGCATAVVEAVAALMPRRIIYVSCDPATLARDLRLFAELGYAAREAQPLDMFPHTGHVETVVLLTESTV